MRTRTIFGSAITGFLLMGGAAMATPVSTLTPITSNGTDVYAVYLFSLAQDTLNLSEVGPDSVTNIFCNYSNGTCSAALSGQTFYLGKPGPGLVFGLTDVSDPATFTTNALGADGYAHAILSATVDASDPAAVNAAFETLGFGPIVSTYADPIAALGQVPGTSVTFVKWEDKIGGDYDYNDFVFAFTDPPAVAAVPEPMTIAMFGLGLAGLIGFGRIARRI